MVGRPSVGWIPWRSCCVFTCSHLFLAPMQLAHGPCEAMRRFRAAGAVLVHQLLWHDAFEHRAFGDGSPGQLDHASVACEQCNASMQALEHILSQCSGGGMMRMCWHGCSEHVANSCSMGAGRLWWGRRLWAAFHGDGVARRDSTHTFAARAACAQLGRGEHVVGQSSEAGASRPNAFGWCTMHQERARCTCQ